MIDDCVLHTTLERDTHSPELLNICLAVGPELAIKSASWDVRQLHVIDNLVAGLHLTLRNAVCNHVDVSAMESVRSQRELRKLKLVAYTKLQNAMNAEAFDMCRYKQRRTTGKGQS